MKRKLILIAVLIMFSLTVNHAFSKDSANLTGETFKEVEAAAWINSEPLKIADQKGKIVVLEFWATWCPPCRQTIPHLIELYNKYKDKNVVFMTFTDEAKETAEPFATEMKMTYPIGVGSKTSKEYGVMGIPHAVIIGADQKIAWSGHPAMPDFEKNLDKLAAAAAPAAGETAEVKADAAPAAGAGKAAEVKTETAAPAANETAEVKTEATAPAGEAGVKTEAAPAEDPACSTGK
jgi:thiol-disulfide isomerase/thioredoxin